MTKEELKQAKKEAKAILKKPFYKKWWFWSIVVIVVIAIGSGGGEDDKVTTNEAKSNSSSSDKIKTSAPKKDEVKTVGIGKAIQVGDVEFIVNDTSTAKNVGGEYGQNAQGTYLLVNTSVKNLGNEAITTDSSFFKLVVGEKTYEADTTAGIYANSEIDFFLEQINPDLTASGIVVFDVSDEVINSSELSLQVQTGFWGTETGTIDLTK